MGLTQGEINTNRAIQELPRLIKDQTVTLQRIAEALEYFVQKDKRETEAIEAIIDKL